MGIFNKKELLKISELEAEINRLNTIIKDVGAEEYLETVKKIELLENNLQNKEIELNKRFYEINKDIEKKSQELNKINNEIKEQKNLLFDISDEVNMQEFGLYKPTYDCLNSEEYAEKIKEIRQLQKNMVKSKTALDYFDSWTLDGSKAKGTALNNDNMKMVLRAFNNECDVLIDKVKFNNLDKIKDRIIKAKNAIDKLNVRNKITITQYYLNLKFRELELVYEFRKKKQEEKDAMRAAREEERELAKLNKEIEEKRKKIEKEHMHYQNALDKFKEQLLTANEDEKKLINEKIDELENVLTDINKNLAEIDYREANQKAGYVYVISNIGAFGENIYKIGMTRRLDPQDRVDELGDASVPFKFDVHAMIFSDNAPKLEASLHRAFEDKKVNMINDRKEFFNVSLEEIEKVIKENHEKLVEIKKYPEAQQYRETLMLRKEKNKK